MGLLNNFWSCSTEFSSFPGHWLVEQFLCIYRQTADRIRLKFGGQTHYGPPQAWLTFGQAPRSVLPYNIFKATVRQVFIFYFRGCYWGGLKYFFSEDKYLWLSLKLLQFWKMAGLQCWKTSHVFVIAVFSLWFQWLFLLQLLCCDSLATLYSFIPYFRDRGAVQYRISVWNSS